MIPSTVSSTAAAAALAAALALIAGGLPGCAPRVPGPRPEADAPPDSVTFVLENRNYRDVRVRLYSDGRQVHRALVVGNTVDTVRLSRHRFRGGRWFRAVLSPVGTRRNYALPRELFPEDADLVLIDVSEHLP